MANTLDINLNNSYNPTIYITILDRGKESHHLVICPLLSLISSNLSHRHKSLLLFSCHLFNPYSQLPIVSHYPPQPILPRVLQIVIQLPVALLIQLILILITNCIHHRQTQTTKCHLHPDIQIITLPTTITMHGILTQVTIIELLQDKIPLFRRTEIIITIEHSTQCPVLTVPFLGIFLLQLL